MAMVARAGAGNAPPQHERQDPEAAVSERRAENSSTVSVGSSVVTGE